MSDFGSPYYKCSAHQRRKHRIMLAKIMAQACQRHLRAAIVWITCSLAVFGVTMQASAQLPKRNLPTAVKLFEDETGTYHAVYVDRYGYPYEGKSSQEKNLRIVAERNVTSSGKVFGTARRQSVNQYDEIVHGYTYDASEVDYFRTKIAPIIERKFSDHPAGHTVYMSVYARDHYLFPAGRDAEKSAGDPERPVLIVAFIKDKKTAEWQPNYHQNEYGFWVTWSSVVPLTMEEVLENRKRKSDRVFASVEAKNARYERFNQEQAQRKKNKLASTLAAMKAARRSGIVYKNAAFWRDYPNHGAIQNVLDGNFHLLNGLSDMGNAFTGYVLAYDDVCQKYMTGELVEHTYYTTNQFGITDPNSVTKVVMEARFSEHYERMRQAFGSQQGRKLLEGFLKVYSSKDPWGAQGDLFTGQVQNFFQQLDNLEETRSLLRSEGCTSPTVRQLGDNLIAVAARLPSMQQSGKSYTNAARYSMPFSEVDAQQHLDKSFLAIAQKNHRKLNGDPLMDDFLQLALGMATVGTNYNPGPRRTRPKGSDLTDLILYKERIEPYKSGVYLYKDWRENRALSDASDALQQMELPVLRCGYGPTRFLRNGKLDTSDRSFWYLERPKGVDAMIAAAETWRDFNIGIRLAVDKCPETVAEADAILNAAKAGLK